MFIRLLVALIFSASPWIGGQAFAQEKPVVFSSFTVIHDWVQVIGGKGFESKLSFLSVAKRTAFSLAHATRKTYVVRP